MRFARVWAMRVPKPYPRKSLRSVGRKGADVLEATGVARIGALEDFVSQDEADHSLREQETSGTDATKMGAIRLRITRCLPGFQTSFFG
jgi:hypothetical protein